MNALSVFQAASSCLFFKHSHNLPATNNITNYVLFARQSTHIEIRKIESPSALIRTLSILVGDARGDAYTTYTTSHRTNEL